MRIKSTFLWAGAVIVALGIGFVSGTAQEADAPRIIGVYGVGGVLSDDGVLWQYMPEERRWMTIDEAFEQTPASSPSAAADRNLQKPADFLWAGSFFLFKGAWGETANRRWFAGQSLSGSQ